MEIQSYLTFDNNDIEFLYSRWHLSWKGHILSVSRKISKSIGIIYKSSLCLLYVLFDYSRPFLTPLLNILCFSKSHNGFSSSGIARGGFQGFQSPLPPPFGLWNWLYFKQRRRKIQKDIMCYIRGYSIIVITKISKRSTHEVFFLIFPSILIALVEAMRVKWAACQKLCVTQPVLYSFNSSLRWKYISSHVHILQFCTHSRHNDAISFSHGCLQINLRELSGTWMLTSAVAWKTAITLYSMGTTTARKAVTLKPSMPRVVGRQQLHQGIQKRWRIGIKQHSQFPG